MNRTYKVKYDSGDIYTNKIVTSNQLINDFLEVSNEFEDADLIGWLQTLIKNDRQDEGVDFICNAWDLILENETE